MGIRLFADKQEANASHSLQIQHMNGEVMVQTSRKAPQEGAATLAMASLTILTLITAMPTYPCNSPLCCTAHGCTEELQLNMVNVNKGASLNALLCSRKCEAQQN